MGYWDPPEYFDQAKYPEIDAETDTLIEHLVGAIKEEYKDVIAKSSDAYQTIKANCDNLIQQLAKKNAELLSKASLIATLQEELNKKTTEHPSFKFNIGDIVYYTRVNYRSEKKVVCPRCSGEGYITLDKENNNLPDDITDPVKYVCPACRNSTGGILYHGAKHYREKSYYTYDVEKGKIESITYVFDGENNTTSYKIKSLVHSDNITLPENKIYDSSEKAIDMAKAEKENSYINACIDVGIAINLINKEVLPNG